MTDEQIDALKAKVEILQAEGYPEDQAYAIAYRMMRDGELHIAKPPKRRRIPTGLQLQTGASLKLGYNKKIRAMIQRQRLKKR